MTLNIWQNDKKLANRIGVAVADKDLIPNPYMREMLLQAIKTLLHSIVHDGRIQVYTHCYDLASNYSLYLDELKKELDYEYATRKVMREVSKNMPTEYDYNYYNNQCLAYENVLNLVEQQIEKDPTNAREPQIK